MHIFFCEHIQSGEVFLNEEESFHCQKVLRLHAGDAVELIDGRGNFAHAVLKNTSGKNCYIEVSAIEPDFKKRNYHLHIGIAPTKNIERFEWFLEKAVELGIDEITPIACNRSHRDKIRMDRLEKIIVSAVKQSIQAYIPKLNPLTKFSDSIVNNSGSKKFIASCSDNKRATFIESVAAGNNVYMLIGPEGDFTPEEVLAANQNGFLNVSLGSSTLRTETAGLYVASIMRFLNEH